MSNVSRHNQRSGGDGRWPRRHGAHRTLIAGGCEVAGDRRSSARRVLTIFPVRRLRSLECRHAFGTDGWRSGSPDACIAVRGLIYRLLMLAAGIRALVCRCHASIGLRGGQNRTDWKSAFAPREALFLASQILAQVHSPPTRSLGCGCWLEIGVCERATLCRRIGLVRDAFQRTNHFIAQTICSELNLRRGLEIFSHHLFEYGAAETFP